LIRLLLSLVLFSFVSFASTIVSDFTEISEKDGLILKDTKKFTGTFIKRNFFVSVNNGEINNLSVLRNNQKIASFAVSKNQFNGASFVSHDVLGKQNLFYKDGCIQSIKTKAYEEIFIDCNFKEGFTTSKEKYTLSSKYPYVLELDVFSFNLISYLFKKTDLKNGLLRKRGEQKVYRNSKLKRIIASVPQAGLNYVISFDSNEKVHSISKFYMDSQSSVIANFKDEILTHIVLFENDVSLVEKYKDGKLGKKENIIKKDNLDFDLFEALSDVLYKSEDGSIYPDVNFE
jgi:hypothetical protein